jgi:hypothetical protein
MPPFLGRLEQRDYPIWRGAWGGSRGADGIEASAASLTRRERPIRSTLTPKMIERAARTPTGIPEKGVRIIRRPRRISAPVRDIW